MENDKKQFLEGLVTACVSAVLQSWASAYPNEAISMLAFFAWFAALVAMVPPAVHEYESQEQLNERNWRIVFVIVWIMLGGAAIYEYAKEADKVNKTVEVSPGYWKVIRE